MDMNLNRVDESYDLKMTAFESDCHDGKGDPNACHHVGEYFSVVKEDYERSSKVYQKNCTDKNYSPSCFNLGRLYMAGKGVLQSDDKAEELFGKSCEGGHLQGCYHKAILLYSEATKDKTNKSLSASDKKKKTAAMAMFDWACKEGEVDSCYFAASEFINPDNTDRAPLKAIDYLTRGCKSNHAPSCYNLAVMYKKGDAGIEKNELLFEKYKKITNDLVSQYGSLQGRRTG